MKKLLTYLFVALLPLAFVGISCANHAFAQESQTATVFVVNGQHIVNTEYGVFVYDSADLSIKQLNSSSPTNSKSFYVGDCLDICSDNKNIYLLTTTGIAVINSATFDISIVAVANIQSYHTKISASVIDSETILCIYPATTENNQTILYGIYDSTGFEFFTITFNADEQSQGKNISLLSFAEYNNSTYLIRAYNSFVTSYEFIASGNQTLSSLASLSLSGGQANDPIVKISNVIVNQTSFLTVTYENRTQVYTFTGDAVSLTHGFSHIFEENTFSCINTSVYQNSLALLDDNNTFYLANITEIESSIASKTSNTVYSIEYRNSSEFEYYKVCSETKLISSLGTTSMFTLPANSFVVEIADVTLSDGSPLVGYKYVMYVDFSTPQPSFGQNYYGFVLSENADVLEKLPQTTVETTVKVFDNSKLYSLPSIVVDDENGLNQVVEYIGENLPVNVISYISGYKHSINDSTTEYALVETTQGIGFIDVKSILSSDQRLILIMPNATLSSGTNIYEEADTNSTVLHRFNEAKRVKILEPRDKNGFIKIAYNDKDGNYFEGFVKATKMSTDSYTTLQIIGSVLVVLNVIFLIVLLITKKKIVR